MRLASAISSRAMPRLSLAACTYFRQMGNAGAMLTSLERGFAEPDEGSIHGSSHPRRSPKCVVQIPRLVGRLSPALGRGYLIVRPDVHPNPEIDLADGGEK